MSLCNSQLTAWYCHFGRCPVGKSCLSRVCLSVCPRTPSCKLGSARTRPRVARRPSSVCLSVCPSVCKLLRASRYFYHKHDTIATKLAHDDPHVGLHPGCAQGQGQGQRSRDTDTFLFCTQVASSTTNRTGSPPNLHMTVPT